MMEVRLTVVCDVKGCEAEIEKTLHPTGLASAKIEISAEGWLLRDALQSEDVCPDHVSSLLLITAASNKGSVGEAILESVAGLRRR